MGMICLEILNAMCMIKKNGITQIYCLSNYKLDHIYTHPYIQEHINLYWKELTNRSQIALSTLRFFVLIKKKLERLNLNSN